MSTVKVSDEDRENLRLLCLMVKEWKLEYAALSNEQTAQFQELDKYMAEDYHDEAEEYFDVSRA